MTTRSPHITNLYPQPDLIGLLRTVTGQPAAHGRKALTDTQNNADRRLAGRTFDTEAGLHRAQLRPDPAANRVDHAREELNAIKKAQNLLTHHDEMARAAAAVIRRAAEVAPDQSLLDKLADFLAGSGDKIKRLVGALVTDPLILPPPADTWPTVGASGATDRV